MEVVKSILCGALVLLNVGIGINLVKKIDIENGLPKKISAWVDMCFFCAGCLIPTVSVISMVLNLIVVTYLCFTAYTDHYTKMVYSCGAYITGTIGIVALLLRNSSMWAVLLGFYGVVVLMTLCRACALGDAEILMAVAPYLIMSTSAPGLVLLTFFILTEVFFLVYAIVLRKAKLQEYCAMAPAITVAALCILQLFY